MASFSSPSSQCIPPACYDALGYVDQSHTQGVLPPTLSTGQSWVKQAKATRLSPHYTLWDMAQVQHLPLTHPAHELNLAWAIWTQPQLTKLCTTLLEPISQHYGGAVALVGAMRYAQWDAKAASWTGLDMETKSIYARRGYPGPGPHALGLACDFLVPGHSVRDVWQWIRHHHPCPWGELAVESVGGLGLGAWVHLSLPYVAPASARLIYGQVYESKLDSMNRPRLSKLVSLATAKRDRWDGAQAWEISTCGKRFPHPHLGAEDGSIKV
jgi:hypothetical protein